MSALRLRRSGRASRALTFQPLEGQLPAQSGAIHIRAAELGATCSKQSATLGRKSGADWLRDQLEVVGPRARVVLLAPSCLVLIAFGAAKLEAKVARRAERSSPAEANRSMAPSGCLQFGAP